MSLWAFHQRQTLEAWCQDDLNQQELKILDRVMTPTPGQSMLEPRLGPCRCSRVAEFGSLEWEVSEKALRCCQDPEPSKSSSLAVLKKAGGPSHKTRAGWWRCGMIVWPSHDKYITYLASISVVKPLQWVKALKG